MMRFDLDVILPHIITTVARFLPPNEVAVNLRPVCKAFKQLLRSYVDVRLSRPVPHHAFLWRWCSQRAMRPLPLRQRLRLVCRVAASGCLDNLQAALAAAGLDPAAEESSKGRIDNYELMTDAAEAGQLYVCQWLQQQGCPWKKTLVAAARAGHQQVCQWALAAGCPWDEKAPGYAACGGHMELAVELRTHHPLQPNTPPVFNFLAGVAYGCNLEALQREVHKWAGVQEPHQEQGQGHQGDIRSLLSDVIAGAASSPTPDWQAKLQWLEAQGYPRSPGCTFQAAMRPNAVERLNWLRQRGYPINSKVVLGIVDAGHTTVLEGLLAEVDADLAVDTGSVALWAVVRDNLDAFKVLHKWGWMVDTERIALSALCNGRLETVVWMVEQVGVHLDQDSLTLAMVSGNMELVEWLLEHHFTWCGSTLHFAADSGWVTMLERLVEQGCSTVFPYEGAPYVAAAHNGDLATLASLRHLGVPWGPAAAHTFPKCVRERGRFAPLSALRWLLEEGCPVDLQEVERRLGERADGPAVRALLEGLAAGAVASSGAKETAAAAATSAGAGAAGSHQG